MTEPLSKHWYVVLSRGSEDFDWWKKGEYEAISPSHALGLAWADTYVQKRRHGTARDVVRCAVVGPECPWTEFDVTLESQPATVSIEAA